MPSQRVLVVGASVAGPALAFWLVRAGYEVVVAEAATQLRLGGNGVDIRDQAIAVVEQMALIDQIRLCAMNPIGFRFAGRDGRARTTVHLATLQGRAGYEDIEISRGDLARLLYESTRENADYRFATAVESFVQDADGVTVTFAGGGSERFDLLIGADGLHSQIRRLAFPRREPLRFRKHYFAFATSDSALSEPGWVTFYNRPGLSVAAGRREGGPDQVHFMFRSEKPLVYDYRDTPTQRRLATEAFAGADWFPRAFMSAIEAPDFYFDALSQVRLPVWSKGRVALVGDAAYCASPASGAGALLALVGAYRLAGELAITAGNHHAAFRNYEAAHRLLVARKQRGLFTGISVPATAFGIWARNQMLASPLVGVLSGMAPSRVAPLKRYDFPPRDILGA